MWWEWQHRGPGVSQIEEGAENSRRGRKKEWVTKGGWMPETERNSTRPEQWVGETQEGDRSIRYRVENNWAVPGPGKEERIVSKVTREDTALFKTGAPLPVRQEGRKEERFAGLVVESWGSASQNLFYFFCWVASELICCEWGGGYLK